MGVWPKERIVIGRILGLLFGFVAAVFLVTLAVANRHTVQLVPIHSIHSTSILAVELPFYCLLFAMLSLESY